jgi:hypothetical protein
VSQFRRDSCDHYRGVCGCQSSTSLLLGDWFVSPDLPADAAVAARSVTQIAAIMLDVNTRMDRS